VFEAGFDGWLPKAAGNGKKGGLEAKHSRRRCGYFSDDHVQAAGWQVDNERLLF